MGRWGLGDGFLIRLRHTIDLKLMQIPEVSRFKGGNKDDQPVVINSGLGKRKEMKKKRKYSKDFINYTFYYIYFNSSCILIVKVDPELFKDVSADIPYPKIQPYFKIDPKMKTK